MMIKAFKAGFNEYLKLSSLLHLKLIIEAYLYIFV